MEPSTLRVIRPLCECDRCRLHLPLDRSFLRARKKPTAGAFFCRAAVAELWDPWGKIHKGPVPCRCSQQKPSRPTFSRKIVARTDRDNRARPNCREQRQTKIYRSNHSFVSFLSKEQITAKKYPS